jgi:hypothetical protein
MATRRRSRHSPTYTVGWSVDETIDIGWTRANPSAKGYWAICTEHS